MASETLALAGGFAPAVLVIHSVMGRSTSSEFFSIIMKCALPRMPILGSTRCSTLQPACFRKATVPAS